MRTSRFAWVFSWHLHSYKGTGELQFLQSSLSLRLFHPRDLMEPHPYPAFTTLLLADFIKGDAILTNTLPELDVFRQLLGLERAKDVGDWLRTAANSCPRTMQKGKKQLESHTIPLIERWTEVDRHLIDSALLKCLVFIKRLPSGSCDADADADEDEDADADADADADVGVGVSPRGIEASFGVSPRGIEASFTSLVILGAIKGELVVNQLDYNNVDVCDVYLGYHRQNNIGLGLWLQKASNFPPPRSRGDALKAYYKSLGQYAENTYYVHLNKKVTDAVEHAGKDFVDNIPTVW